MATPPEILDLAYARASQQVSKPIVNSPAVVGRVEYVCRLLSNRGGIRWLLSSLLAKIDRPQIDIRKPFTKIGDPDAYSGRDYDTKYLPPFLKKYHLPANPTTAYLTPALRNRNTVLTSDTDLVGRPPELYRAVLQLLDDVYRKRVSPEDMLAETVRQLIIVRDENKQRMETLLKGLSTSPDAIPLSSEAIVTLIRQHLDTRGSSRLPVLIVAAAYNAASNYLKERILPLESHNAADRQTGSLGDLEITLVDDSDIVTSYEMKERPVTIEDLDQALDKIDKSGKRIDNYIFITTSPIDESVQQYARSVYEKTGGIEIVILDCLSFLRHFLHLFHRLRVHYLNEYQDLVLAEPDSAISQPLKEAFLALRRAAESALNAVADESEETEG